VVAWAQALLLAFAAVRVFVAVAADGRPDAELLRQAGAILGCSELFGLVAEVSAIPGFVAASVVLPCAEVRAWALRLAVAVQLTFAALVGVVTVQVLVGLSGLFPIAGRGAFGPPVLIVLGLTFALRAVYTFLQYNLYEAGQRAGRADGN